MEQLLAAQFESLIQERDEVAENLRETNLQLHKLNESLYELCIFIHGKHDFSEAKYFDKCLYCGKLNELEWDEDE